MCKCLCVCMCVCVYVCVCVCVCMYVCMYVCVSVLVRTCMLAGEGGGRALSVYASICGWVGGFGWVVTLSG